MCMKLLVTPVATGRRAGHIKAGQTVRGCSGRPHPYSEIQPLQATLGAWLPRVAVSAMESETKKWLLKSGRTVWP